MLYEVITIASHQPSAPPAPSRARGARPARRCCRSGGGGRRRTHASVITSYSIHYTKLYEETRRRGLGRGLSALLGEEQPAAGEATRTLPVGRLYPGRYQPRQRFDTESLSALADSIREKGIVEPIVVRKHPDRAGDYEIA